jgi:hypothetical protein
MLDSLVTGPEFPPGPNTDERKKASSPKPTVYRSNGSETPDVVVPDPAAGTADPADEPPLPVVAVPDPVVNRPALVPAPVPVPAPVLAPVLAPSPFPEEPAPKRRGCWYVVMGGLGIVGLFAMVVGVALWLAFGRAPDRLTSTDSDPEAHRDWELVASAMGTVGVKAERTCKAPPYLAIEATVLADGKVSRIDLLNYDHEPTRACIEQEFMRETLPRNRAVPVRVAVTLQE